MRDSPGLTSAYELEIQSFNPMDTAFSQRWKRSKIR
jgi:hypothetical protein